MTSTTLEDQIVAALRRCIEIATTQEALADRLSALTGKTVKQSKISMWLHRKNVPPEWVIPLEQSVGGEVSRYDIRPDLYPRDHPAPSSHLLLSRDAEFARQD